MNSLDACRFSTRRRSRHGVLILVVLGLLAIFLMVGVAYVLTTGNYHAMSRSRSGARTYMSETRETMDAALYQVLRDTKSNRSVIKEHSLLNDLYGNDGFMGTIDSASTTSGTGGLFLNITLGTPESATDGRPHALSTTRGAYAGSVFTVVGGTEIGRSTRIVGYDGVDTLTVRSWQTRNGQVASPGNLSGARYVVNGHPFNGMGAGYNPATGKCDLLEGANQSALLPNRSWKHARSANHAAYPWGGMDESYDAADFQNMFLAFLPTNYDESDLTRLPVPSFHRPDLYKFWQAQRGSPNPPSTIGTFPVRSIMRPMTGGLSGEFDFPAMPMGSLPGGSAQYGTGPYDVDNDGDSVRESVWLDLGFPDATSTDGFNYRPLFAFLIVDLDGRLNLNAAGNSTHFDDTYYKLPATPAAPTSAPTSLELAGVAAGTTVVPRGEGTGPAEIRLDGGGGAIAPLIPASEYQALLQGNATWPGRYGISTDGVPGAKGQIEKIALAHLFGIPANFNAGIFSAGSLGRPIHDRGQLAWGLGRNGSPIYEHLPAGDQRIGSPYQLNLSNTATRGQVTGSTSDAPFSINELECLLRPFDRDTAGLPQRIPGLAPSIYPNRDLRRLFTTESISLPVPFVNVPRAVRSDNNVNYETTFGATALGNNVRVPASIADVLKQRLVASGLAPVAANAEIVKLLAPEVLRGERFDLNRLLGNGADDNGNGVVDEWSETGESLEYPTASSSVSVPIDYTNGAPNVPNSPLGARQLMARYLYCLAMLLRDNVNIDFDGNPDNNSAAETAQGFAQWAINVVDFRDADSIMTPFEYDPNPFNGWSPDGDLNTIAETERGVVWGLERPELLITETIAWHDRATENRTDDPSGRNLANGDSDFDQRFRPKGAAFIELYNPWTGQDKYPADLYTNAAGTPVLNLDRLSVEGNSPIWRMLVVQGESRESRAVTSATYYDPDGINAEDVERSIYFSHDYSSISGHGVAYCPSDSSRLSPIHPGGYAVVGSAGRPHENTFVSTIGHQTSDPDGHDVNIPATRRVVLSPATGQVSLLSNNAGSPESTTSTAAAIAIDSPRSFSISEPDGVTESYYPNSVTDVKTSDISTYTVTPGSEGKYGPKPIGHPLDAARATADPRWAALMQNGTVQDFRTILLQRLANPLIAWNASTNPYITIDVSSMNLTAFNGSEPGTTADPSLGKPTLPSEFKTIANANLASFQRGQGDVAHARTLWAHEFSSMPPTEGATDTTHIKGRAVKHSLGYLNESYGSYGEAFPDDIGGQTFPWLTWNNRPFISPMELMLVPRSKASRLAFDYTPLATASPIVSGKLPVNYQGEAGTYGHLLNFFDCRIGAGQHLYRLLDYVGIPSPFVGTREMFNPDPSLAESFGKSSAPDGFRAPLNTISQFRDPGRININTINDARVWQAIVGTHSGATWNQLVTSRRGYGAESGVMLLSNPSMPSYFANPFRAAVAGSLVPITNMEVNDIDASLLRSYPHATSGMEGSGALFQPQASSKFNQADRNPYFRYQEAGRMSNLVTTQSNLYAVWVTMGYFVTNGLPTNLWREWGIESHGGERHRAFYIIDRSIPVAFEPGENHNVDDTILVRRQLE